MTKSCQLKHIIEIQTPPTDAQQQDSYGQPITTWPLYRRARAFIEPLNGRELFAAQQVNAETTTRMTIRYFAGLDPRMRIVHEGVIYNIHSIIDPEMRHAWLVIMCGSGVNLG